MRHSLCQLSLSSEDTSPDAKRALIRLAEKLKKNNVVLDMIAFGDRIEADEGRHSILRMFVMNASLSNVCHSHTLPISRRYLAAPPG
jgi:hypothetical protein